MGTAEATKADGAWGSLACPRPQPATPEKKAYIAMLAAVVLDERSRGVPIGDIERRWSLCNLDGTEESWRDTALWLLSGHTALFQVRGFYHHLRECCSATNEQPRATKRALSAKRREAYDLLERLKYCSPSVRSCWSSCLPRRAGNEPMLGVGTIRKLEAAGVSTSQQVTKTMGRRRRCLRPVSSDDLPSKSQRTCGDVSGRIADSGVEKPCVH